MRPPFSIHRYEVKYDEFQDHEEIDDKRDVKELIL